MKRGESKGKSKRESGREEWKDDGLSKIEHRTLRKFKKDYKHIYESVFEKKENVFIQGPGGTGKSYCLEKLKEIANILGIQCYKTSTTGCSAFKIGGTTVHSFGGIGIGKGSFDAIIKKIHSRDETLRRWLSCQILIIDEISMLGASTLELLSEVANQVRQSGLQLSSHNNIPFGGIQIVASGDFLQLQPINDDFCFKSLVWEELNFKIINMDIPYRYPDIYHFNMLQRIRCGKQTKDDIDKLRGRVIAYNIYNKYEKDPVKFYFDELGDYFVRAKLGQGIKYLNPDIQKIIVEYIDPTGDIKPTRLYSRKADVERFNMNELDKLEGKSYTYQCEDTFMPKHNRSIEYEDKKYYRELLDTNIPPKIVLKPKAQVMLTYNLDTESNLVNGARGIVKECHKSYAIVMFRGGGEVQINYNKYEYEDDNVKCYRSQIPLILAWSSTIHKSQGSTLDYCIIDLGPSIFVPALSYVSLSRVRRLDGILLSSFMPVKLMCNKEALEFYEKIRKASDDVLEIVLDC